MEPKHHEGSLLKIFLTLEASMKFFGPLTLSATSIIDNRPAIDHIVSDWHSKAFQMHSYLMSPASFRIASNHCLVTFLIIKLNFEHCLRCFNSIFLHLSKISYFLRITAVMKILLIVFHIHPFLHHHFFILRGDLPEIALNSRKILFAHLLAMHGQSEFISSLLVFSQKHHP